MNTIEYTFSIQKINQTVPWRRENVLNMLRTILNNSQFATAKRKSLSLNRRYCVCVNVRLQVAVLELNF